MMLVVWNIIIYLFKRNYVNFIYIYVFIYFDGLKFQFEKFKILVIMIFQFFGIEGIEDKNFDVFIFLIYVDL